MKLIPSYQEFVYDLPLNGKISPELAESLAAKFEEIDSLNEGFLDSIKNTFFCRLKIGFHFLGSFWEKKRHIRRMLNQNSLIYRCGINGRV